MVKCASCGGKLRRVHRKFLERFEYLAMYECMECREQQAEVHRYQYHLGEYSRCPRCGTFKLTRLKQPDKIDPMVGGFLNLVELVLGGKRLCHCRYCRIQFYDRRDLLAAGPAAAKVCSTGDQLGPQHL